MVISVLERRSEIGLRRALGTTRRHVAEQFLGEALLLSVLGGLAGTVIGGAATAIYAVSQHWSVQIPALAIEGGVGAALPSAPSPACTRRCEPPASRQPRRCARHDRPPGPSPRPDGLPAHPRQVTTINAAPGSTAHASGQVYQATSTTRRVTATLRASQRRTASSPGARSPWPAAPSGSFSAPPRPPYSPYQGLGDRHPARCLGRRPRRGSAHRPACRAAARQPRRPSVTHTGTVDAVTCAAARI